MGKISRLKIIVLTALLIFSGILLLRIDGGSQPKNEKKLTDSLSTIDGWQSRGFEKLDRDIVEMLNLDDYLNQSYRKDGFLIQLYIGYYQSAEKVGAAHDPLVCFPGQGWVVTEQGKGNLAINNKNKILYSSMVVERPNSKKLVLYWFQAHDKTNSNTFMQKANLIILKTLGRGEENAFVRIISDIGDRHLLDVRKDQLDFIKAFYPSFLEYICQ